MPDDDLAEILRLLERCEKAPETGPVEGASEEQLRSLEHSLWLKLPEPLVRWLRVCNACVAGPGALLGAATSNRLTDIALTQRGWVEWRVACWIPVAGDGCGNSWVLDGADPLDSSVYFVDVFEPDRFSYIAASTLEGFLFQLLADELTPSRWPFDKDQMAREDPAMFECSKAPLPWDG